MTDLKRRFTRRAIPAVADIDAEAWFGSYGRALTEQQRAYAWEAVSQKLSTVFPGAGLQRTPTLTGAFCAESCLPAGAAYPLVDADAQAIISKQPQHRQACYILPGRDPLGVACYDRRLAYLRYLRHLPCAIGGVERDRLAFYDGDRPGWYRISATVPRDWAHIGLVPVPRGDGITWAWPDRPGEDFDAWVSWREVELLEAKGWPLAIRERILFDSRGAPGRDPLRTFSERILRVLAPIEASGDLAPIARAVRFALRACVLYLVGYLARPPMQSSAVYPSWAETPPEGPGDYAEQLEDGRVRLWRAAPRESLQGRWYRPEWAVAVWAASRVAITRDALTIPREQLGAIDGDALYVLDDDGQLWPPSTRPGDLRPDGLWVAAARPASLTDFRRIKAGGLLVAR